MGSDPRNVLRLAGALLLAAAVAALWIPADKDA